jgi:hypothetical protein
MRAWRTLLVCGGLTSVLFSQGAPAKPDTPEQAADKVLAAIAVQDDAVLKALAEKDNPDPWLVTDELCARGAFGACPRTWRRSACGRRRTRHARSCGMLRGHGRLATTTT